MRIKTLPLTLLLLVEALTIGCQLSTTKRECTHGEVRVWADKENKPEMWLDMCNEDFMLEHDQ